MLHCIWLYIYTVYIYGHVYSTGYVLPYIMYILDLSQMIDAWLGLLQGWGWSVPLNETT